MSENSVEGHRYFATFIDDYSQYVFVYNLKHKSEIVDKFQDFHRHVTSNSKDRIATLQSDSFALIPQHRRTKFQIKANSMIFIGYGKNAHAYKLLDPLTKCIYLRADIRKVKGRLVAKGCAQIYGVEYFDTYSPVIKLTTIRILIAVAVEGNMLLHQIDISNAFLNGKLKEDIFMEHPEGFIINPNNVCKLNRSIYGLKQSPRCWNNMLTEYLKNNGFAESNSDPVFVYSKRQQVYNNRRICGRYHNCFKKSRRLGTYKNGTWYSI
ncbi:hypothetical protein GJ496_004659 [Pomphorhynchus laevis]|nr:hypothetical protein GJ496_004659 [Pomphorhynchus laevis]